MTNQPTQKTTRGLTLTLVNKEGLNARPMLVTLVFIEELLNINTWRLLAETAPSPGMESLALDVYCRHPS